MKMQLVTLLVVSDLSFLFVDFFSQAFEDSLRKNRSVISNWLKYAQWEESQREIQRFINYYFIMMIAIIIIIIIIIIILI